MRSIGFLHVARSDMPVARKLVAEHAPWLSHVHVVDETLLEDLHADADGRFTRLAARIGELVGRDVDTVVCTSPELLADVAATARRLGVPAIGAEDVAALTGAPRPVAAA